MSRKPAPPQTGVEIISGLPGSGKSMYAVQKIMRAILILRRPVYTNLPLRIRVVRKYLTVKSGDQILANYIQPLTPTHFHAYCKRMQALQIWKDERRAAGLSFSEEIFELEHGPHISTGPNANWIPYCSIMVIDEAHQEGWFPESVKSGMKEDRSILAYASMHRHALHWVWLMTQNPMNISITWRRMCSKFITAVDMSTMPFAWGFRFPFKLYHYAEYAGAFGRDGKPESLGAPIATSAYLPWFDAGNVVWRLYDSHTHCGSLHKMNRALDRMRLAIEGERPQAAEPAPDLIKEKRMKHFVWLKRIGWAAGIIFVVFTIYLFTRPDPKPLETEKPKPTGRTNRTGNQTPNQKTKQELTPDVATLISDSIVIYGGRTYKLGDFASINDVPMRLLAVNPEESTSLWASEDAATVATLRVGAPPVSRSVQPGPAGPPAGNPRPEPAKAAPNKAAPAGGRPPQAPKVGAENPGRN